MLGSTCNLHVTHLAGGNHSQNLREWHHHVPSSSTPTSIGHGARTNEPTTTNRGWHVMRSWKRRIWVRSDANHWWLRGLRWVSLHVIARIGQFQRIGIQGNCQSQTGIRVRLSISGVPRRQEVLADVVQSNLAVRLVWVEKRARDWNLKRTVVEDVDPHSCALRHHWGIQH